jgi:hypothetical protein
MKNRKEELLTKQLQVPIKSTYIKIPFRNLRNWFMTHYLVKNDLFEAYIKAKFSQQKFELMTAILKYLCM